MLNVIHTQQLYCPLSVFNRDNCNSNVYYCSRNGGGGNTTTSPGRRLRQSFREQQRRRQGQHSEELLIEILISFKSISVPCCTLVVPMKLIHSRTKMRSLPAGSSRHSGGGRRPPAPTLTSARPTPNATVTKVGKFCQYHTSADAVLNLNFEYQP